jgi:hypothetical protein
MEDFDFISDEKFKILLNRDILELKICLENKATKSALIMSGSIIEAILLEYFTHNPPAGMNKNQILKLALSDLIDKAFDVNLISSTAKDLCSVIRNYRNLIHPGKEIRTNESYNYDTAVVSSSLVNIVLKEVKEKYMQTYGYKAENIFNKILNDEYANVIFEQLLEKINQNEKNKLLDILTNYQLTTAKEYNEKDLYTFFRTVKLKASEDKLLEQLKFLVKQVEQGEEPTILGMFLLYGDCLNKLETKEKDLVLKYVYNIAEKLNYTSSKLYSYLSIYNDDTEESKKMYLKLLMCVVYTFARDKKPAKWTYFNIYNDLTEKFDVSHKEKIRKYIEKNAILGSATKFYKEYDSSDDLPF